MGLDELMLHASHEPQSFQLTRLLNLLGHDPVPKDPDPVRIGVLGASQVSLSLCVQRVACARAS
jgi:hypothetical protein